MGKVIIPPIKPLPVNPTIEQRIKMLQDYEAEMRRCNPHMFNADGSQKSIWQQLKALFNWRRNYG